MYYTNMLKTGKTMCMGGGITWELCAIAHFFCKSVKKKKTTPNKKVTEKRLNNFSPYGQFCSWFYNFMIDFSLRETETDHYLLQKKKIVLTG